MPVQFIRKNWNNGKSIFSGTSANNRFYYALFAISFSTTSVYLLTEEKTQKTSSLLSHSPSPLNLKKKGEINTLAKPLWFLPLSSGKHFVLPQQYRKNWKKVYNFVSLHLHPTRLRCEARDNEFAEQNEEQNRTKSQVNRNLKESKKNQNQIQSEIIATSSSSSALVPERKTDGGDEFLFSSNRYERMTLPPRADLSSHIIFGTLLNTDLIERYEIYKDLKLFDHNIDANEKNINSNKNSNIDNIVRAVITYGKSLDGHKGIVHGGILALTIDDIMGFAFWALGIPFAVTANLSIDYRKPVPAGSTVHLHVQLVKRENRKLYFRAQITCPRNEIIYTEATSLYITPKSSPK